DVKEVASDKMNVDPRAWSGFFQYLKIVPNFQDNLKEIAQIGMGFVGDAIVHFITAVRNNADVLPEPSKLLTMTQESFNKIMEEYCGVIGDRTKPYKSDTAAVIVLRLQYHLLKMANEGPISKEIINRVLSL